MILQDITTKMDLLREELDSLRPIPEDRINRLNQKLRLDWNFNSNSIEGNTLSASETKAFLFYGITAQGKPFRDYIEMRGHDEALKKLENIIHSDLKITENLIKEFHKIILVEPYIGEAEINPGEYKKHANYLFSPVGERIDFEPPEEVPRLMNELVNWLNNHIDPPKRQKRKYDLHPLLIASGFHIQFIQIHPFGDGNGRMARILTNLILMLSGYVPAIIKLEKRKEYYTALNLSTLENAEPFAEYLGEECIQTLEMAIKAAKGESIDEPEDIDKKIALLDRELETIDTENEIKKQLNNEVFFEIYDSWFTHLATETINMIQKFNKYFTGIKHRIIIQNNIAFIEFNNESPNVTLQLLRNQCLTKEIQLNSEDIIISLQSFYGTFIKGGLNTFNCNYGFDIKFELNKYVINVDILNEDFLRTKKEITKKLLHQPLTNDEIKEVVRVLSDTIYRHIVYFSKNKGNKDNG